MPVVASINNRPSGGIIPYLDGRVGAGWGQPGNRTSDEDYQMLLKKLKKTSLDYSRMFSQSAALVSAHEVTVCGLKFFGADRVLFASDSPFESQQRAACTRWAIAIVDHLDLPWEQRQAIYGNARWLCNLN